MECFGEAYTATFRNSLKPLLDPNLDCVPIHDNVCNPNMFCRIFGRWSPDARVLEVAIELTVNRLRYIQHSGAGSQNNWPNRGSGIVRFFRVDSDDIKNPEE